MAVAQRMPEPLDADAIDHFVYLRGVSFGEYEAVLEMRGDSSVPRITYLEGVLELMSPSRYHENDKKRFARLLETWALETGVRLEGIGSWTLKNCREERGAEPDVIQDGVYYSSVGTVGSYKAWYEYFPKIPVFNTTMVVSPGNSMTFWAWEGDAACVNGAGHTGRGCFWYRNNTTNTTAGTFNVVAPNGLFVGKTAEAIIERQPNVYLSKFGTVAAMDFASVDSTGAWHNFTSDHYKWIGCVSHGTT